MNGMGPSGWMEAAHWIGVALAAPASAFVLLACWREIRVHERDTTKEESTR